MRRFWEKGLERLTPEEWEALCDHCGRCCLVKLEDEDTGEIFTTSVVCALYDPVRGGCTDYARRFARMPDCLRVTPETVATIPWLPDTCAYRRVHEGRPLPAWHPLICGDPQGPAKAGAAVHGRVVSEALVPADDLPCYMTDWPDPAEEAPAAPGAGEASAATPAPAADDREED